MDRKLEMPLGQLTARAWKRPSIQIHLELSTLLGGRLSSAWSTEHQNTRLTQKKIPVEVSRRGTVSWPGAELRG